MSNINYDELINNRHPIDANDPAYEKIFRDLQGGIIKNYGRDYSLYIFIQFDENKQEEIKQWIRDEIAYSVTSTWRQLNDTEIFKGIKQRGLSFPGKLCKNFFLSWSGYENLGLDPNQSASKIDDALFIDGMKKDWDDSYKIDAASASPENYWYNPPEFWDLGGKNRIDALFSLAHNSLEELKNEAKAILFKFDSEEIGKILACEPGLVVRDRNNIPIGPFGFTDGISQPLFLKGDYDKYCKTENIEQWDPKASLKLVLKKDPLGEAYSFGSYCVWKKIETNHQLFNQKVNELADTLECDPERAGALVIGRFKDGTPIAISDKFNQISEDFSLSNSFNYADDSSGRKCPLQAHIRKVNPRQDKGDKSSAEERRSNNRIFRAGITYFEPPTEPEQLEPTMLQLCLNKLDYVGYINNISQRTEIDQSISGLLFVCFQSSITNQFSLMQKQWADSREFPRQAEDGSSKYLDPLIGHPAIRDQQNLPVPQEWPKKWDGDQVSAQPFYGCVREKGGEFFFAPSISFLRNL